jgi:hypothetical protein
MRLTYRAATLPATLAASLAATLALAACAGDPVGLRAPTARPSLALSATGATIVTEADIVRLTEGSTTTPPVTGWVLTTRVNATTTPATGAFRVGPTSAASTEVPEGVGSFEISTPNGADKAYLFSYDYKGKALSTLSTLAYQTYRSAGSLQQVAALNLQVDFNGAADGGFTTLVYEPVYNTDQGAVESGRWQAWDAYRGGQATWWSSRAIPGVCAFSCFVTWNEIIAVNPAAVITGGIGVNQGSGNAALTTAVDAFAIGFGSTTLFDFEPYVTAASRAACKDGGWTTVKRADGTGFKNQGDCVAFVEAGK